jgi:hypothetical protein
MSSRITQQQLESYLWGAAVLLRGTIDAGDYKQYIFPLLFLKRLCDVYDEETVTALRDSGGDQDFALFPENHRFQIPPEAHWSEVRKAGRDVGRTLQTAMRSIETSNQSKLMGIFGDAQWTNKDRLSDAMLRDLIEHFSSLELTVANLPEDELGQGYEYLIKKFADELALFDAAVRKIGNLRDDEASPRNRLTIFLVAGDGAVGDLYGDKSGRIGGYYIARVKGSIAVVPQLFAMGRGRAV